MMLDQQAIHELRQARQEGWNEELRYQYPLDENSTVWDVGAWNGTWAREIQKRYNCTIHCFEILSFRLEQLLGDFRNQDKVVVHEYGLGDSNKTLTIKDDHDCTSTLITGTTEVQLRDVAEVLEEPVDLMKINIEGGEYDLINRLYQTGKLHLVDNIQIQFHDILILNGVYLPVPDAEPLYRDSVMQLESTHERQWCQPWVWESWRKK